MRNDQRFSLGCRFDTPHRRLLYPKAVGPAGFLASSPTLSTGTVSTAAFEALVTDQGAGAAGTGSCQGHRGAMAAWMSFLAKNQALPWFPSPDGIYRDARCQERAPLADGTLPPLTDSGCMTSDAGIIFATCGLRKMHGPTPDGRNSDVTVQTVNDEPKLNELDAEAETVVLVNAKVYLVDLSSTPSALAAIQVALSTPGMAVCADIFCDSIFQDWFASWTASTPPLSACNRNDPTGGGHAVLLNEMRVTSANAVTLSGLNSWGLIGAPPLVQTGCINGAGHWQGDATWFEQAVQQVTIWDCTRAA
jgi:hypothetical protein